MENSVKNLKFVIMSEYCDDPPAGCVTMYHCDCDESISRIMWTYDEASSHVAYGFGWDPDEDPEEDMPEELAGFMELRKREAPTAEFLKNASFDTGGAGFSCECYAEGEDILPAMLEFIDEKFWIDEDDEPEKAEIVNRAKAADPSDREILDQLLDLLKEEIEDHNFNAL